MIAQFVLYIRIRNICSDYGIMLGLINKGAGSITVKLPAKLAKHRASAERRLRAPSLAAQTGIRFEEVPPGAKGTVAVPPYMTVLLTWQ
jgi:hypothetical protein